LLVWQPSFCHAGTFTLTFQPATGERFTWGESTLKPPDGQVAAICRFDHSTFAVDSLARLIVKSPDGAARPFIVESSSVLDEFDEIISVRFAFFATREELEKPGWMLSWDASNSSQFTEVSEFILDAGLSDGYFEARWGDSGGAGGDGAESSAVIEIIADSSADYYSLWYLLPMVLLFGLLTYRKMRPTVQRHG
jgi:hypothetical protein